MGDEKRRKDHDSPDDVENACSRLPDESREAFRRFLEYRDLGPAG
jgi:hypothetical protein